MLVIGILVRVQAVHTASFMYMYMYSQSSDDRLRSKNPTSYTEGVFRPFYVPLTRN
jgi:hypothetical protein